MDRRPRRRRLGRGGLTAADALADIRANHELAKEKELEKARKQQEKEARHKQKEEEMAKKLQEKEARDKQKEEDKAKKQQEKETRDKQKEEEMARKQQEKEARDKQKGAADAAALDSVLDAIKTHGADAVTKGQAHKGTLRAVMRAQGVTTLTSTSRNDLMSSVLALPAIQDAVHEQAKKSRAGKMKRAIFDM